MCEWGTEVPLPYAMQLKRDRTFWRWMTLAGLVVGYLIGVLT